MWLKFVKHVTTLLRKARKREKQLSKDLYTSLEDLPVWNWNKFEETQDIKYLSKTLTKHKGLSELIKSLEDESYKLFGINKDYKAFLLKEKSLLLLKIKYKLSGDRSLITKIKITEHELNDLLKTFKKVEKQSLDKQASILENWKGFYLDPKIIPVNRWYTYMEEYSLHIKNLQNVNNKRK